MPLDKHRRVVFSLLLVLDIIWIIGLTWLARLGESGFTDRGFDDDEIFQSTGSMGPCARYLETHPSTIHVEADPAKGFVERGDVITFVCTKIETFPLLH